MPLHSTRLSHPLAQAAALAVALAAFPAMAAPPAAGAPGAPDIGRLARHGHMVLASGTLTAPSARAPQDVARGFLADRPDMLGGADPGTLALARTAPLTRGHILRYTQTHAGLDVMGGDTVVRIDDAGQVRWAVSGARAIADDIDLTPVLSGRDALALVGGHAGHAAHALDAIDPAAATRLVIYAHPMMKAPRLAYQVELPMDLQRMQKIRAFVDAETGVVYMSENLVRYQSLPTCSGGVAQAYVYDPNPIESQLSCVSLAPYLNPGATTLANADVVVRNCIDTNACRNIDGSSVHFCDDVATATADGGGHFTDYVFASDTEPEDAFAEVQMFYHVNKVYEKARSLGGFQDTNARPLTALVNFRAPSFGPASQCTSVTYDGAEALEPFDNAVFVPRGQLFSNVFPEDDAIIFGQGSKGDFSYDGDVVYHEFGHAVMAAVSPELGFYGFDSQGLHVMPGALHEGYADLMTMFVTDDPEVGEYTIRGLNPGASEIRNLANVATCPASLLGESHEDSLPFTGAIWQARQAVGTTAATKDAFDRAVFAAQQGLELFETFESAARKTLLELETSMGAAVATQVEAIFQARGLIGDEASGTLACNGRVVDGSETQRFLLLVGTDRIPFDQIPGPVQLRYEVAQEASSITLEIGVSAADGPLFGPGDEGAQPSMLVVAERSDGPIRWTLDSAGISGAYTYSAEVVFEDVPDRDGVKSGKARITGDLPAGVYHVQIVNQGPSWQVAQVSLADLPAEGGCGCRAGGRDAGAAAGMALLLLAVLAGRSRRLRRIAVRAR